MRTKEQQKRYNQNYRSTEHGKEVIRRCNLRYSRSAKGKATAKARARKNETKPENARKWANNLADYIEKIESERTFND